MLFLNFKGKIRSDDIRKLEDAGLSPDDIKQLIDNSGQLFEDLGQAIKKAVGTDGRLDEDLFANIEHFWFFDGRLNDVYKSDMIGRFADKLKENNRLYETFIKRLALEPENIDVDEIELLLNAFFKVNI